MREKQWSKLTNEDQPHLWATARGCVPLTQRLGWHDDLQIAHSPSLTSGKMTSSCEKKARSSSCKVIGEGHGIGLCQAGAKAMAEAGADFREILTHYYPNTLTITLGS